jgi:parallel beta-helix repeat protein
VRELLDAPGEWYLDADAGRLYLMPGEGFGDDAEVVAPALERIVEIIAGEGETVGHLRFEGLTLRCTDYSPEDNNAGYGMGSDGVIRLEGASDCRVSDCVFTGIGKYAVCASGGGGHLISRNEIGQSASGGVLLLGSAGNEVSNNRIHDCGLVYKHIGAVAMQGEGAGDNLISHNYIHDMSRYAITMKNAGLRNIVEFNWIERTNLETYDTGAIEVTQHNREVRSGSIIRNNIVGDTVGYSSRLEKPHLGAWGIYLDSYASGYTVTNNICYRSPFGGIMFQGGHGNVVTNNIFVDGAQRQGALSNFRDGFADNVLERNVFYYTNPGALLFNGRPFTPDVMRVDNNVYYCPGIEEPVIRAGGAATWQQWLELGFDANSVIADPMFVDAENDDYTLAPDSPAFALGFEPIDIGRIGVD